MASLSWSARSDKPGKLCPERSPFGSAPHRCWRKCGRQNRQARSRQDRRELPQCCPRHRRLAAMSLRRTVMPERLLTIPSCRDRDTANAVSFTGGRDAADTLTERDRCKTGKRLHRAKNVARSSHSVQSWGKVQKRLPLPGHLRICSPGLPAPKTTAATIYTYRGPVTI